MTLPSKCNYLSLSLSHSHLSFHCLAWVMWAGAVHHISKVQLVYWQYHVATSTYMETIGPV